MSEEKSKPVEAQPVTDAEESAELQEEAVVVDEQSEAIKAAPSATTDADKKPEPSLQEAMKDQAREDEKPLSTNFSLRKILGGDWLTAEFLRRQIGIILLITGFIIVYISNRYSCQKDLLEIDRLNNELVDAKYRALSTTSELTEKCRESNVMEMLQTNKDSVLKVASQPPYIISIPKNYSSLTEEK
ncbi:MAG: hypothetical protein K5893_02440 [Prevotella sp.]|nr:hypothetical protein [Prevotella sp.]